MNEKENIRAEIEAKLRRFDQTLTEVKKTAESRSSNLTDALGQPATALRQKIEAAQNKLGELTDSTDDSWKSLSAELENHMHDIDDSLRRALAFYK
jgi:hypothetical protein